MRQPRNELTANVLGQDLSLEYDERQQQWRALFGVDLETEPGAYRMVIQRSGSTTPATRTMRVVPRQFRIRRLKVVTRVRRSAARNTRAN